MRAPSRTAFRALGVIVVLLASGCSGGSSAQRPGMPRSVAAPTQAPTSTPWSAGAESAGSAKLAAPRNEAPSHGGGRAASPAARCADGQRCLAPFRGLEQISVAEARDWWPFEPVLMPAGPLSTAEYEYGIAAWTHGGVGRQGDPRSTNASLYLYRYPAGRDFDMRRFFRMLADGALVLDLAAGAAGPTAGKEQADGVVKIRGREAFYFESYGADSPDGKIDIRQIWWVDLQPSGRQVQAVLWSDPTAHSIGEVVAWADSLRDV